MRSAPVPELVFKKTPAHYGEPGDFCYVTSHTLHYQKLFTSPEYATLLKDTILFTAKELGFELVAYSILPHHFHLVIRLGSKTIPSEILKRIKGRSAREINKRRGMVGSSIWETRYFCRILNTEKSLNRAATYVYLNPVKHGLVKDPKDWEFCGLFGGFAL